MTTAAPIDRRAALKARHRARILAAADELVQERRGARFSAEELAERADIAKRTVFNHFASIDEVLLALCGDELEVIIDDFIAAVAAVPPGDGSRAAMFDEIATMLRSADLPSVIARVLLILGGPALDDPRGRTLSDQAFARAGGRLLAEVVRRNPGQDPLDAQILVGSLMNGVIVVAEHWIVTTGGTLDDAGLDGWRRLLTQMIESVRSGYRPVS